MLSFLKKIYTTFMHYFLWDFATRFFIFFYLVPRFNFRKEKGSDPFPKAPFFMISNHGTFFDPWIVGGMSLKPMSIMMNEEGFHAPPFVQWYLHHIGTFPKKKGASDYKAMKETLKRIKEGHPILIFPEGQTTWDGETQPIYSGVEKLVKRTSVPLVMARAKGNFLCRPWWADSQRTGSVRVFLKVLRPEHIKSLSEQELLQIMINHIYNNDIKDEENLKINVTGKNLAAGLERFVWMCRQCGTEDTLVTQVNTITCTACNSSWTMDAHFRFKPHREGIAEIGDLHDWSQWHKQKVKEKLAQTAESDILTKSDNAAYGTINNDGSYSTFAEGNLALNKQLLTFTPHTQSQHQVNAPVHEIRDYVFQRKDIFEFDFNGKTHRFRFFKHSPMKWVFYLRYMNRYEECEKRGYI